MAEGAGEAGAALTMSSATQRPKRPGELDAYFTPEPLARAVVARLAQCSVNPHRILEPSSGRGAFLRSACSQWPGAMVDAVDLDPTARVAAEVSGAAFLAADFLTLAGAGWDLILGNPPFNAAAHHILHALQLLRPGGTLAFLLRLGFLAGQLRVPLWTAHRPRWVWVLSRRPSFTGGPTDASDYAVAVWRPTGPPTPTELDWLHWAP